MEKRQKSIRYFEDFSNEIIYEIFDYLNFCQIYDGFSNLNRRFQNLLHHPTFPININLSFISKSTFQRYYTQIIYPNQHRIQTLKLNNPFIIYSIFLSNTTELQLIRLEKLLLHNIKSKFLDNLLTYLACLPYLSSLTMIFKHKIPNKSIFYHQLFRLSVLKYCQISLNGSDQYKLLPYATNQFSPIETLLIKDSCSFDEFYILLPYLPQLRRLSVPFLFGFVNKNSIILKHLTHLSIDDGCISFDTLEMMIENFFPQIQVLYFSTSNREYFDVNRWKQLITSHMTYLRIFDIQISYSLIFNENITDYISQIDQFKSSFWYKRNWFFEHHISRMGSGYHIHLFSTKFYRRNKYILYKEQNTNINQKIFIDSVNHLEIRNKLEATNSMKYFPNVIELTISCNFTTDDDYFLLTILKDLIPLKQLTKLTIEYYHGSFSKILELIYCTPNLHTLNMNSILFNKINLLFYEQYEIFQLVSETNNIKEINTTWPSTLEEIKFLVKLFPRLQCLTIHEYADDLDFVLNLLLLKHNVNTHTSFLDIKVTLQVISDIVKTMINSDNLLNNYSTEVITDDTLMIYTW